MSRRLVLAAPGRVELLAVDSHRLAPGEIRLRAIASGISHGTEMHLYRGRAAMNDHAFDRELRMFVRNSFSRSNYPLPLGYETVAEVVEVADDITDFAVGDVVHAPVPHQEESVVQTREPLPIGYPLLKLPVTVAPEAALFVALGSVALAAVHDAQLSLGASVLVSGLGTVGLLAVQMARLSGARSIVALDPLAMRRTLALRYGAGYALDPTALPRGVANEIKGELGMEVDVAIETSGSDAALQACLETVRMAGRVVAAAMYPDGAPRLNLGREWHVNRLTLLSSMNAWECPSRDHPHWDRARTAATTLDMLVDGSLSTTDLITQRFPFASGADAYRFIDGNPESTVKVVLTYA